jgi:uncharacterized protein (TIGR02757 family)
MKSKRTTQIKNILERLYAKYNHRNLIAPDPLQFVYRYSNRADMEIAALLSAELAYGRVQQIQKNLAELFVRMGNSPYTFVQGFGKSERKKLRGFKHRFTSGDDISALLELLKIVLDKNGSIENYFLVGYNRNDENIATALTKFSDSLLDMYASTHNRAPSKGLRYLLTRPADGSACKRLNLFLRWMVRNDDVDTGLWRSIDKSKLIVPVDVHMARLCKILGLYNRKTASLTAAIEITQSFSKIEPSDPVKYDFALSRIGIVENCTGHYSIDCKDCELASFCQQ